MRGSQSSATLADDRRMTRKRAVILPQAMWEVQAIREVDQDKLSGEDGRLTRLTAWSTEVRPVFSQVGRWRMKRCASIAVSV